MLRSKSHSFSFYYLLQPLLQSTYCCVQFEYNWDILLCHNIAPWTLTYIRCSLFMFCILIIHSYSQVTKKYVLLKWMSCQLSTSSHMSVFSQWCSRCNVSAAAQRKASWFTLLNAPRCSRTSWYFWHTSFVFGHTKCFSGIINIVVIWTLKHRHSLSAHSHTLRVGSLQSSGRKQKAVTKSGQFSAVFSLHRKSPKPPHPVGSDSNLWKYYNRPISLYSLQLFKLWSGSLLNCYTVDLLFLLMVQPPFYMNSYMNQLSRLVSLKLHK